MRTRFVAKLIPLLLILLTVACNQPTPEPPAADAQATIAALTVENASLNTQVATLEAQTVITAAADAPVGGGATGIISSPLALPMATPLAEVRSFVQDNDTGPLPYIVAEIALAQPDQTLVDLRLDQAANRLYVTD